MKYVYPTDRLKRYRFPTHINDLVYDRAEAACSEAFVVVIEPGGAPPLHKHDDTEQAFHVIEGSGTLFTGQERSAHPVRQGDVVLVPPGTWHTIRAEGGPLRYLAVDCFGSAPRLEATWDEHARALCAERGWNYDEVVGGGAARVQESGVGNREGTA